jgi:hypothetical protein
LTFTACYRDSFTFYLTFSVEKGNDIHCFCKGGFVQSIKTIRYDNYIEYEDKGNPLRTRTRKVGTNTQLYSENVKGRGHSRDLSVDGKITLKCRLSKTETESEGVDWIQPAQGRA